MNNETAELHAMIHACLDGQASDEQLLRLNSLLRSDAAVRDLFLELADIHSCLAVDEQLWVGGSADSPTLTATGSRRNGRRFTSLLVRPFTAAAAGLVIGLFSASVVFAYAAPRKEVARPVPLFTESFEEDEWNPQRGFPTQAEIWSGDLSSGIPTENEVKPKAGQRMVRLVPHATRKFSYAWRIVDLKTHPMPAGAESGQVEVTASFHKGDSNVAERFQIRLAAFAEEPGNVKAIWNGSNMFDQVLQHVGRTVTVNPENCDWQTLHTKMDIPPNTRSLVISLAAAMSDDSAPKTAHYLDDVTVSFTLRTVDP